MPCDETHTVYCNFCALVLTHGQLNIFHAHIDVLHRTLTERTVECIYEQENVFARTNESRLY